MTDDTQQTIPPKPDFLRTAAPLADTLSKSIAGIAIALYACGFLVVSLYHAKFGFVGTNPFRPRVLAAGAWFSFFTAIPVSIAFRYRNKPWSKIANDAYPLWLAAWALSVPLSFIIFEFSSYQDYQPLGKWVLTVSILSVVAVILADILKSKKKGPQWLPALLSVPAVLYFAFYPLRNLFTNHHFDTSTVTLWFFVAFLVIKLELSIRSGRSLADGGEWSKPLVLVFSLLLVFSLEIYPHLKASWGGGTPENVTVYFSKDSLLNPNKAVQAQLIEESDEGFYIVGPKELKAIFIPRSAVAMIYFADKPADSPMLQNVK
jgi:hypothetical protein